MNLSNLSPAPGAVKKRKRVGRGPGSGHGKTATRGHKGRKARSGGNTAPRFEGGQMPLQRRLPKRGFHNIFRTEYTVVNLGQLESRFEAGAVVGIDSFSSAFKAKGNVKILAHGELTKKLTVQAHKFSDAAKKRIEELGGSAEVIGRA
jgi:large subunit ribosomal protein L15